MKKITSLLCLLFACMYIQAQVTYYVSSSGNDENDGSQAMPFASVAKAVSVVAANTPTIIYLEENAVFLETGSSNSSRINFPTNVDLEITGKNSTIQAFATLPETSQYHRIFRIASGNVKLKGLIFENGFPSSVGGAIFFAGETLEIDGCIFKNNVSGNATTSGGGSAIACRGKNLTIRNSYFQGNKTYGGAGATIMHSGNNGTFVIENCTFSENSITTGDSNGSVFSFYDVVEPSNKGPKAISITNCTFFNNSIENRDASGSGVIALHASMNATEAFVVNNTFLFNRRDPLTSLDDERSDSEKAKTIYKRNVGVRIEGTAHKLHFINNAVSGLRYAISATATTGRAIVAKNNYMITMSKHANVSEFAVTEENTPDANGNILIIQTTNTGDPIQSAVAGLNEKMSLLELATTLNADKAIPYLAIEDKNCPLVNTGLNSYMVNSTELVPEKDILGTVRASLSDDTGDKVDIGAFELVVEPEKNVSLTIPTNVYLNEQITFSATSENVTSPVYTYSVKVPGSNDFVTATSPYQPTAIGTHTFKVAVAENGAETIILDEDTQDVLVKAIPTVDLTIPASVYLNEQITFSATAENVTTPVYTYSVKVPESNDFVTVTSPYQPTAIGTHTFKVTVAESGAETIMLAEDTQDVLVKAVPTVALTIPASVYVNEQITFSATAENVTTPVYTYSVKAPESNDFVTVESPYQPTVTGTYTFKVTVAESGAETTILAEDTQNVQVKAVPTVALTIPASVFINEQIAFSATSESVTSPVYTYSVKVPESNDFVTVDSPYQPAVTGTYSFKVTVAESGAETIILAEDIQSVEVKAIPTSLPENSLELAVAVYQQNGYITVCNNSKDNMTVNVMLVNGKQVAQWQLNNNSSLLINKNQLPKGVMILVFDNGISKISKKVLL